MKFLTKDLLDILVRDFEREGYSFEYSFKKMSPKEFNPQDFA